MQYCPPSLLLQHAGIKQHENVDPSILVRAAAALCLAAESSPQGRLEIQGVQLSTADIRYLFDGLLEHPQARLWHRLIQSDDEVMKFLMNGESLKSPLYAYNLMLAYPDFRQFTMLWVSNAAYRFLIEDMLNEATPCLFYFLEPIHKRGDYWEQAVQDAMLKILNQTEIELKQIIQINWREVEMDNFKKQALSYKKLDCLYILYRRSTKEPPSYFLDLLEFADKLADYKLLSWSTTIRMLVDKYTSLSPSIHQRLRQSGFTPTTQTVFPAGKEIKPQPRRERDNWERDSDENLISAFKTLMKWISPH